MMRWRLPIVSLALGWIGGVLPHLVGRDVLLREILLPALPNVSLPVGSESDFVSLVPHLYRALCIASFAVLVTEPAKYRLGSEGPRLYALALAYQAVLFLDLLRWYAYDWFLYGLHFARLIDLNANPVVIKNWCTFGAPWVSFLAMVLLLLVATQSGRRSAVHGSI